MTLKGYNQHYVAATSKNHLLPSKLLGEKTVKD